MNSKLRFYQFPLLLTGFILITIPLLFGAVHPIVCAVYVALVFVGFGYWLCFLVEPQSLTSISNIWLYPLVLVLVWSLAQSITVPLSWVELVSSARAGRVEMLNNLAGTDLDFIPLSDNGLLSLTSSILMVAVLLFFFSLKQIMHENEKAFRIIVLIIVLVGVFEALYGLLQFLNPQLGILWLPLKYRAACGTIIYKNQYASLLNMCWPLALACAAGFLKGTSNKFAKKSNKQELKKRLRHMGNKEKQAPLFLLATAIILLAVLFSMSRGGMISMLLVMFLLSFVLPVSRKAKLVFAGLLICFSWLYGSLLGWETLLLRFDTIAEGGAGRFAIYVQSFNMLQEHWLTGIGFGSYSLLSPVYLKNIASTAHFDKTHNEYLQLAIELGVPMATFLFFWVLWRMNVAWIALRGYHKKYGKELPSQLIIGGAAFCGLVGFFFHGIADFGWRLPANLFYAATLVALLSHSLESEHQAS